MKVRDGVANKYVNLKNAFSHVQIAWKTMCMMITNKENFNLDCS